MSLHKCVSRFAGLPTLAEIRRGFKLYGNKNFSLQRFITGLVLFIGIPLAAAQPAPIQGSEDIKFRSLLELAPHVDPSALRAGLAAVTRAKESGAASRSDVLALIDYSRPSTEPRLWVFDLARNRLLFEELVAHGKNSGAKYASRFSNELGSRMSSLGTFVTAGTYHGQHGYTLLLKGLEPGVNDKSIERRIVLHSAAYVSNSFIQRRGYLGRSWGCPAVRPEIARELIDTLRGGAVLYAYYPERTETAHLVD